MSRKNLKELKKIVIIGIIIITFLVGAIEGFLVRDFYAHLHNKNREIIRYYEANYKTIIEGYKLLSRSYYDNIINKSFVLENFKNARDDKEKRDKLREELIAYLDKSFKDAQKDGFRQIHFVFNDNISYLRMHKLDKYGDDLTNIRETVSYVNREKEFIEGFEEGRVLNGYRYEYPLFLEDEYLGCVEVSISFGAIVSIMDNVFDTSSIFMLDKNIVEEKVWDDLLDENYAKTNISDDYYIDKNILNYLKNTDKVNRIESRFNKFNNLKIEVKDNMKNNTSFVFYTNINKKPCSMVFLSIKNILNKHVGYLVFLDENQDLYQFYNNFMVKTIFLIILWLVIIISIFIFYKSRKDINKLLFYDKLTNAYNRNYLYKFINNEIERKKRYNQQFSIIMYDIDKFKLVNDTYGHIIGDSILKETSNLVIKNIRKTDYFVRFGGDEFIILLPNTELEKALLVAEKIREKIFKGTYSKKCVKNISISCGVCEYKQGEDDKELIKKVDKALYRAKEKGRNRVSN
jgi:diguanylate cyclase (GGDEF)-like protein